MEIVIAEEGRREDEVKTLRFTLNLKSTRPCVFEEHRLLLYVSYVA